MKGFFKKFLLTSLITSVTFTSVGSANSVVIRDSVTGNEALEIQSLTGLYGDISFEAPKTGKALITTAAYQSDGTLLSVVTDPVDMTAGEVVKHSTRSVNSTLADFVKVFIWDKEDLSPILTNPYIIHKIGTLEEKFITKTVENVKLWDTVTLGDLFEESSKELNNPIKSSEVSVNVSGIEYTYTKDEEDWKMSTLFVDSLGTATVTITDNRLCQNAEIEFTVIEPDPVERYEVLFKNTDKYTYRVGNLNAVSVGSLFNAVAGAQIVSDSVEVLVENVDGDAAGVFSKDSSDWTKGTVQFSGTGIVDVTIKDSRYGIPKTVTLEVVDATNTTGAASATKGNVVLLNDSGFGSLEVSNGYTLYGNGFKLTCSSDSYASDMGYSFVTLNNGTLDNVQIICPNFSHAVLYSSNMKDSANQSYTDANNKTRYYNVRSAILATGNNTIANSYVSGGRAAVYVTSGTTVFDNSTVKGGAVANVQVGPATSGVVFKDATLVQVPTQANVNNTENTLLGFSVLLMADDSGVSAPVTLEGNLIQYAWIDESDKEYIPEDGQMLVDPLLAKTEYIHQIDGVDSLNLGIACMASAVGSALKEPTINDKRTNKDTVPYGLDNVTVLSSTAAYVYSIKNSVETDSSLTVEPTFTPNKYNEILPAVSYSDTNENRVFSKEFDATRGWINKLSVDLDAGAYTFDFGKLEVIKNGTKLEFTVTDKNGNSVDKLTAVNLGVGNLDYILTAIDGEGKEYTLNFTVSATKTSINSPELVAANYADALCVASSKGGTWHGAAPALEGIQIKYWSVKESAYKTITLSDYTPTTAGQLNGTNKTWTYTHTDNDFTLTLTGGQVHSGNQVYAMPVVCDGKLYFVPASSNGLVNTGNDPRTIPVSYEFKDNATDTALKFSHTWSVAENQDAEYKYSDFCDGKLTLLDSSSGGGNCVTPETLITLADGSQKEVQYLTGDEELLVWNLKEGAYDTAPIVFVDSENSKEYEVVKLSFSDDSYTELIYEHGYFDIDLGEYVYIDKENANEFIGHSFVKQDDIENNTWKNVELTDVEIEKRVTKAYSPVTFEHLCYYVDGYLSMPGGIEGLFNIFEVDTDKMCYDSEKMNEDIQSYGLFSYEDFEALIPEIVFEAFNGDILKVAIGKGMLTWEDIEILAERYVPLVK